MKRPPGIQHAAHCTDCSEQGDLWPEPTKAKGRFPKFQQFPEQLVIQSTPSLSKLYHMPSGSSSWFLVLKDHFLIPLKKKNTTESLLVTWPQRCTRTICKSDMGFYSNLFSPWHLIQTALEHCSLHQERETTMSGNEKRLHTHTPQDSRMKTSISGVSCCCSITY